MNKQPTYNLYMGAIQALPTNVKYSYYNPDTKFVLLYSEDTPDCGDYRLIPEELHGRLQPNEIRWLASVKMAINAEFVKINAEEVADAMNEFVKKFEEELKREKENFEKVKNGQQKEQNTTK